MKIYFSKNKDGSDRLEFTGVIGVELDDELQEIFMTKRIWSNIALNDMFESYSRKMSLINHFSDQETDNDKSRIAKMRQLAKILKEMLNLSCYYAIFEF